MKWYISCKSFTELEKVETMAFTSVAVDLRITQFVNGVKGVHAILPHCSIHKNQSTLRGKFIFSKSALIV
ncbi:hypothetical protein [Metabacillus idriensis]|uniref:hypothetical protein n=1 Tax=Metabacillus idriensis TaxID=324768 RepID=UPI00296658B0|nr:hypothetical protein [Metabacillus idriensis]